MTSTSDAAARATASGSSPSATAGRAPRVRTRSRLDSERVMPVTNRPAGARYVDCRWPEHHLTVELDSYRYHRSRYAWEQDRRREREAYARGDGFRRYTWGDVFEHPGQMLAELRALLSQPAAPSRLNG